MESENYKLSIIFHTVGQWTQLQNGAAGVIGIGNRVQVDVTAQFADIPVMSMLCIDFTGPGLVDLEAPLEDKYTFSHVVRGTDKVELARNTSPMLSFDHPHVMLPFASILHFPVQSKEPQYLAIELVQEPFLVLATYYVYMESKAILAMPSEQQLKQFGRNGHEPLPMHGQNREQRRHPLA